MPTPFRRRLREATSASAVGELTRAQPSPDDPSDDESVEGHVCQDCTDGWMADGSPCDTCGGSGITPTTREATLTTAARKRVPRADFAIPAKAPGPGSYPIPDLAHARDALARASGKPEEGTVRAAVYAKFPQLKESDDRLAAMSAEAVRLREGRKDVLATTHAATKRAKTTDGRDGFEMILIQEGKGSTGYYTPDALRELVESRRADGMQAYADHPGLDEEATLPERSVRDLVGTHHDLKLAESGGKTVIKSIFVPIKGPGFEWVSTLAEAASQHPGPKPLAGVSLYGGSEGSYSDLPDGTFGWLPSKLLPTSGDIVTNGGAGGEFARQLLESMRRSRGTQTTGHERITVKITEFQGKVREAHGKLAAADTDDKRTAALNELEQLGAAEIDTPAPTIETLPPALVESLRESVKAETATDTEELREQNREMSVKLGLVTQDQDARRIVRESEIPEADQEWFVNEIKTRNLREADAMTAFVEAQLSRDQRIRESFFAEVGGVEGAPSRRPQNADAEASRALGVLRETGVPLKTPAAA